MVPSVPRVALVPSQPELSLQTPAPADPAKLRAYLLDHAWRTRAQICADLRWTERRLRDAAEALGPEVVRGQAGFKLTSRLDRDDLPAANQAADAFISQGKRMIKYAFALKRRLHALLG